jgi:hypothetical protein
VADVTSHEAYWVAGLLEGEGHFGLKGRILTPLVSLGMTDRDIVERYQRLVGGKRVYCVPRPPHKTQWVCRINGRLAVAS